jgi:hypothetical protein
MLTSLAYSLVLTAAIAPANATSLVDAFEKTVRPFLQEHCLSCHGQDKIKGNLDLRTFSSVAQVAAALPQWETILSQLKQEDMPPAEAPQPSEKHRAQIVAWIEEIRRSEAIRNAGDPGVVLARRLSNAEYDDTIADLTGVDLRPTRDFPVDPANEAGFDNSGESLAMSPALLLKYYDAAKAVADHLVLTPSGITFAPHPVITETDRDKFCVNRIVQFYKQQNINLADYFEAAWRLRSSSGSKTSKQVAKEFRVSQRYLELVFKTLSGTQQTVGPIAALQALWRSLPTRSTGSAQAVRSRCEEMRDLVLRLRARTNVVVPNLKLKSANNGAQALVLWKDRQMAANRRTYGGGALNLSPEDIGPNPLAQKFLKTPRRAGPQATYESSFETFANVFPDAFYVSERTRIFSESEEDIAIDKANGGRLLSAGFHNQMGYFRDDQPLYDLLLSSDEKKQLDKLWQELDFVTESSLRQHASLIWFERSESGYLREPVFDFARSEDKDVVGDEKFDRFASAYLEKAHRITNDATVLQAVKEHFERTKANIHWVVQTKTASESNQLQALQNFAERAYRRRIGAVERDDIKAFYKKLRNQDGRSHEEAIRDSVASILVSPQFAYRFDRAQKGQSRQALGDYELANRLSYFLWSSMPDQELMAAADAGQLHKPEVLRAQARRMLRDARIRNFAKEFAGNWLDFRRFEEHKAVDLDHFKSFTSTLRQSMFEEPLRFVENAIRQDEPVLDFLYGKYTFVNAALAGHYGMPAPSPDSWKRIDDADKYGRGGILPMAVFLTKNAPGLRTSPVKRGVWAVERVLGEKIPAPPANVPTLPADESQMGNITLRETLERHRQDKACSPCHSRFDSFGLVFENYGPIGERRNLDLGGRPVETTGAFPNGKSVEGLVGLRKYIRDNRQNDFVENLCRKLLAYGLGRTLIPSDDLTIERMRTALAANKHKIGTIFEQIVTSPQFLNKRG